MLDLIGGHRKPDAGEIKVNGDQVMNINLELDSFSMSMTLKEYLGASHTEEDVIKALAHVGIVNSLTVKDATSSTVLIEALESNSHIEERTKQNLISKLKRIKNDKACNERTLSSLSRF